MDDQNTTSESFKDKPLKNDSIVSDADTTISLLDEKNQKDGDTYEPTKGTDYIRDVSVFTHSSFDDQTTAAEPQGDTKAGEPFARPIFITLAIVLGCLLAATLTYWGFSVGAYWAGRGRPAMQVTNPDNKMHSKFLNHPIPIFKTPPNESSAAVTSGVFTNTGISLQCRFQWAADQTVQLEDEAKMILTDGAYPLMSKGISDIQAAESRAGGVELLDKDAPGSFQAEPYRVTFANQNTMLARVDFEPGRSLQDRLVLTIQGLNKSIDLDQRLATKDLFAFTEKEPQRVAVDEAVIVLEGMERRGAYLVLVLHGEKLNSPARCAVEVDAVLLAKDIQGDDIKIPGQCFTGHNGSDILFPIGMQSSIRLSPETIQLELRKINLYHMEIDIPLELASFSQNPNGERQKAQCALEDAFVCRLAYKAGKIPRSDIAGFHETLLSGAEFTRAYESETPLPNASYSAQVSMLSIEENILYACVWECWEEKVSAHRVTAKLWDGCWVIESDEVL